MDTIAPVVTLRGATSLVLMQGGIYTENGATWIDGVDGTGVV